MTKLDLVLERIRLLSPERQEAIAVDLEFLLRDEVEGSLLTDEQWADLRRRMVEPQGEPIPHEQIVAEFEKKFGR